MSVSIIISIISISLSLLVFIISYIVLPIYNSKNNFSNKVIKRIINDQAELLNVKVWINKPFGRNYCEVVEYLINNFKYLCDDILQRGNMIEKEMVSKIYFILYKNIKKNLKKLLNYTFTIKFRNNIITPFSSISAGLDPGDIRIKKKDSISFTEINNYFKTMFSITIDGNKILLSEKWKLIAKQIKKSKKN